MGRLNPVSDDEEDEVVEAAAVDGEEADGEGDGASVLRFDLRVRFWGLDRFRPAAAAGPGPVLGAAITDAESLRCDSRFELGARVESVDKRKCPNPVNVHFCSLCTLTKLD